MSEERTEVVGAKKLPKTELIKLDNSGLIEELAALTGSTSGSQVVNLALSAFAWIVESKRQNKHIYAAEVLPANEDDIDELDISVSADAK